MAFGPPTILFSIWASLQALPTLERQLIISLGAVRLAPPTALPTAGRWLEVEYACGLPGKGGTRRVRAPVVPAAEGDHLSCLHTAVSAATLYTSISSAPERLLPAGAAEPDTYVTRYV